jgi:hypothetical protein
MRLTLTLIGLALYFVAIAIVIHRIRNGHLPHDAADDASEGEGFNHFGDTSNSTGERDHA